MGITESSPITLKYFSSSVSPSSYELSLTSENARCHVKSYQLKSPAPAGITQSSNCLTADTSTDCKTIYFPLTTAQTYVPQYDVTMEGGNSITFDVNIVVV